MFDEAAQPNPTGGDKKSFYEENFLYLPKKTEIGKRYCFETIANASGFMPQKRFFSALTNIFMFSFRLLQFIKIKYTW